LSSSQERSVLFVDYGDACCYSAPRRKCRHELHSSRLQYCDQIVEDAVGDIFIEYAFIAKALQVQLQALELYALAIRRVGNRQCPKVGLPSLRADGSEFRADDLNYVVSIGKLILKRFQDFAGIFGHGAFSHLRTIVPQQRASG